MTVYARDTFDLIHLTKIRGFIVFTPFGQKNPVVENRREHIDIIADRLEELDREIGNLEKLADKAVEEVKAAYHKQIEDLFLKKAKVQDQVDKLKKASGNAWEDMKAGTELSWEVFQDSLKRGKSKS
jgi:hypothetical protein